MRQPDLRRRITDQVLAHLEAGVKPWVRPWSDDPAAGFPTNIISRKRYSGINPIILGAASLTHNFTSRWWATFNQWKSLGAKVRRRPDGVPPGRWGTQVVFYQPVEREVRGESGEVKTETFPLLRTYTLFNADQVDGVPANRLQPAGPTIPSSPQQRFTAAEAALAQCGADLRHGGDRAFYLRPVGEWPRHTGGDHIQLPHARQFGTPADYVSTLSHELCHWAEVRLGWTGSYALGELAAELGSVYLAAELNVPNGEHVENHASYVAHWAKACRDDDRALFRAAAQASRAADFLLSFSRPKPEGAIGEVPAEVLAA